MQNKFRSPWAFLPGLFVLLAGLLFVSSTAYSQTATATPVATTVGTSATATPIAGTTATRTPIVGTTVTRTPIVGGTATPTPVAGVTETVIPVTANQGPRTVSVSGSGIVNAQPDRGVIVLGVRTEDEDAAQSLTMNNTQMQSLLTALRSAGVAQADIRTLTIQLQPRYQPPPTTDPNGPATVSGFIAINTVEVTVRDLDNLGQLIDAAIAAGGNQIEGIRFEFSDPSVLLDQARQAAMQDARHKAEQLATLADSRLGLALTINESSAIPVPFARDMLQSAQGGEVPISPGTQAIQVDIQVTWELQ